MIETKTYKVLIAAPGDVEKERRVLKRVIDTVNGHLQTLEQPCRFELYSWNEDTYPDIGLPEKNLLSQIPIEGADILVGIFWKRFGTATGQYHIDGHPFLSGTEQEIETAIEVRQRVGKPVIMIFRKLDRISPNLSDSEIEQLRLLSKYLDEFKKAGAQRGLIREFNSREFSNILTKAFLKLMADTCIRDQFSLSKSSYTHKGIEFAKPLAPNCERRNQALLDIVRKAILDSEKLGPQLINFWGGNGIGKTTLLKEIPELEEIRDFQLQNPAHFNDGQGRKPYDLTVLTGYLQTFPKTVALFDNVDTALDRKEESLDLGKTVRAFLDTNSTIVVTSQYKIYQWPKDIQFCQKDFRMPLLTALDISQMLQKDNISDEFVFTYGYPKVMDWLVNKKSDERSIAQKATEHFMNGLPSESKDLLFHTSLLPLFNPAVLQRVNEGTNQPSISYGKYIDLLNTFEKTGLIYWDEEWGIYRFTHSPTRRLIAKHHLFQDPLGYRRTHQVAADYFTNETKRHSYFPYFFVSAVYHTIMMYEDKKLAKRMALEWLDHNIQPWIGFDQTAVFNTWETGGKEPDVRLDIQEILTVQNYLDVLQRLLASKKAAEV